MSIQMHQVAGVVAPLSNHSGGLLEVAREGWSTPGIAANELVPVVIAVATWGAQWKGRTMCFHSDNMAVVAMVKQGLSCDPALMHLLSSASLPLTSNFSTVLNILLGSPTQQQKLFHKMILHSSILCFHRLLVSQCAHQCQLCRCQKDPAGAWRAAQCCSSVL